MALPLPEAYIVNVFYQHAGSPRYSAHAKTFQASCPSCREGKSWLKKRRLFYYVTEGRFHCFNCGWSGSAMKWVMEMTGKTAYEVRVDSEEYDTVDVNKTHVENTASTQPTLPGECVNLMDKQQLEYHASNKVVVKAHEYMKMRRMDTAINCPDALYCCLNGNVHSDRLIIPFYDAKGKIVHYQSRAFLETDDGPRYLSKSGSRKTLFGMNKINKQIWQRLYL